MGLDHLAEKSVVSPCVEIRGSRWRGISVSSAHDDVGTTTSRGARLLRRSGNGAAAAAGGGDCALCAVRGDVVGSADDAGAEHVWYGRVSRYTLSCGILDSRIMNTVVRE